MQEEGTARGQRAQRGVVTRTFLPRDVLAGFMDENHFRAFAGENLSALKPDEQQALFDSAAQARAEVGGLVPPADFSAELRPVDSAVQDQFDSDETFAAAVQAPHRFSWLRLENLVAVQASVNAQDEAVPDDEPGLIDYALPAAWNVPAEITVMPPAGPVYISGSSPNLTSLNVRVEAEHARIVIEPPVHINLIQVMQWDGRYYLRNGNHRVVGALAAGRTELPALVLDAGHPDEVGLPGLGFGGFNAGYLASLTRPPLVSDFGAAGSIGMMMREKRYGASVSLTISPLNIGV